MRGRVFWPRMEKDIDQYITKVCSCIKKRKPNHLQQSLLDTIATSQVLDITGIDVQPFHIDNWSGGYQYTGLLVATNHFTKFAKAYATPNKSTKAAAEKVFNDFILYFGMPACLLIFLVIKKDYKTLC